MEYEYSANYYVGVGVSNCACVESDGCAHDRVLVCTQCVRAPLFYSRPWDNSLENVVTVVWRAINICQRWARAFFLSAVSLFALSAKIVDLPALPIDDLLCFCCPFLSLSIFTYISLLYLQGKFFFSTPRFLAACQKAVQNFNPREGVVWVV